MKATPSFVRKRGAVSGKARVHELAQELGISSRKLLAMLKEQGEFVKSASSMIEAPVARRVRELLASQPVRPRSRPPLSRPTSPAVVVAPQPVTATEAYEIMRIRPATIRQWVSRGYLRRVGSRGQAALYDREDLVKVRNMTEGRRNAPPSFPVLNLPANYHDSLITTTEAATLLGVAASTVRSWVTRGYLVPARRHRHGHLFTIGSVLTAADERTKRIWYGPAR